MTEDAESSPERDIAEQWCRQRGEGWCVLTELGRGGTAPVFEVQTPEGLRALKIYEEEFSVGEKGKIERERLDLQLTLRDHNCPSLVQIYDGGEFSGRLFLLMGRAPGRELEKCLQEIPRTKVRQILSEVTKAAMFLKEKGLCHRDIKAANIFVSDDYTRVTLLDISVIRDIHDPVGVGTDQNGQLPILATARYSPPEYLFRLLDPSPQLWHALNIYQLGALLHDLLMKQPLFEFEFLRSKENRYRFAWLVATTIPHINGDVDLDLLLLSRRALDKNWERRSVLELEDFLDKSGVQTEHALMMFGLTSDRSVEDPGGVPMAKEARLDDVANGLRERIRLYLSTQGVTAQHFVRHGDDDLSKLLHFKWTPLSESAKASEVTELGLDVSLALETHFGMDAFASSVTLRGEISGKIRTETISLPDVGDQPEAVALLATQTTSALGVLALALSKRKGEA